MRPKRKVYGEPAVKVSKTHLQAGINELEADRQGRERKDLEDKGVAELQAEWAQYKGRAKSAMNRRA